MAGFCYSGRYSSDRWQFTQHINSNDNKFALTEPYIRPQTSYYGSKMSVAQGTGIWTVADAIKQIKKKKKKKKRNKNVFMSMVYAHTTRKTDLLCKIFHLNHVFMTPMTPIYLSVIEPTWANGAHKSTHTVCLKRHQSRSHELITLTFPWSHVLQRLRDRTYWSRWRCVIWLILVFIIIILNQQLFVWLKPLFDSYHFLKKRHLSLVAGTFDGSLSLGKIIDKG